MANLAEFSLDFGPKKKDPWRQSDTETQGLVIHVWLVVSIPLKNIIIVSWDDDIPNWMEIHKIHLIGGFNPPENESQIGSSSQLLGNIKNHSDAYLSRISHAINWTIPKPTDSRRPAAVLMPRGHDCSTRLCNTFPLWNTEAPSVDFHFSNLFLVSKVETSKTTA